MSINTKEVKSCNIRKPISEITFLYTWEIQINEWKEYLVLDVSKLLDQFWDDENAVWWKKTQPTLIRKAIAWEKITTYVKNDKWEYTPETQITAKEWDFVFQNINDPYDTYIPQNQNIMKEYEPINAGESVWENFIQFIRKSKPSKLLVWIIKQPTVITVKSWGDMKQFLDEWATLKLELKKDGFEVTGINKGWFEAWSITDKNWTILNNKF